MLLSVLVYFFYSYKVKDVDTSASIRLTDAEIVEKAKQLGMVTMTEALEQGSQAVIEDDVIINKALELGMVFPLSTEQQEDEITENEENLEDSSEDLNEDMQQPEEDEDKQTQVPETEKPVETPRKEEPAAPVEKQTEIVETQENTETSGLNELPVDVEGYGDFETSENTPDINTESEENSGNTEGMESLADGNEGEATLVLVDIQQGLNANEIALKLNNAGIISDADGFLTFLIESNVTKRIIYGKFYFYKNEPYDSILSKLTV